MVEEELEDLKKTKEQLNKEIGKKEWQGFKNRFKEASLLEKIIFIAGVIVIIFLLYKLGGIIGAWIR